MVNKNNDFSLSFFGRFFEKKTFSTAFLTFLKKKQTSKKALAAVLRARTRDDVVFFFERSITARE